MKKVLVILFTLLATPVYGQVVAQGAAGKNPWLVSATGNWLTDAQLRAVAVAISGTVTANQGGTWTVGVSGSVAVTGTFWQATQPISGNVGQGNATSVAGSWPFVLTDNVDTAQVVSTSNGLNTTVKGLVTQSVMWIKNNDSSVTEWTGATLPSDAGQYPVVRALRTIRKQGPTIINVNGGDINISLETHHLESIAFKFTNTAFVGTLEVYGSVNGQGVIFSKVFNYITGKWISTPIINPTDSILGFTVPGAGFQAVGIRAIAYTSGSLTGWVEGGPGTNTIYADVSGSTVREQPTSISTVTSVASSATNVTCLASNVNRLGASIFNDSTVVLYVKLGATASTTSFTTKLLADTFFALPFSYTGIVDCIWASATGNARVTEVTQ